MLLDIENLTVALPGAETRRPVLDEVALTVEPGEVVGLVGESGSGKSTTARAVLRLLPEGASVRGRASVGGTDVLAASPAELTELRSRRVSMVFQDPRSVLNPVRRVGDFLTERLILALGTPKAEARAKALDLMTEVGLNRPEERFRQYPHEMSGGMLQRVVLAAALATEPELLLADEATSALDATTQAEVLSVLRDLRESRGMGVLFITHDLHLAAAYCHRVHVMYAGRVVESREASALFADPRHPYTRGLIACKPRSRSPARRPRCPPPSTAARSPRAAPRRSTPVRPGGRARTRCPTAVWPVCGRRGRTSGPRPSTPEPKGRTPSAGTRRHDEPERSGSVGERTAQGLPHGPRRAGPGGGGRRLVRTRARWLPGRGRRVRLRQEHRGPDAGGPGTARRRGDPGGGSDPRDA
ncbi:ABC transporter family protein [Nocardiopsis alba ATCC BAA-2165]|uniref:ABC transporter family protein n=1 Tax=Nocardiopsis alba (strain ATCC BAA-2165 / BE74) TaxID=1205910 RepID=J7LE78_NOCAA|nr:ABC transporter family protein [Nocardiopsis alba ATCC BAA-2165]